MNPFRAERYLESLREKHACADAAIPDHLAAALDCRRLLVAGPGAGRFLRQIAWLWARVVLDARSDTLQLPVFAAGRDVRAAGGLAALVEAGWPEIDWRERLRAGAVLILIEEAEPDTVRREVEFWPACRFIAGSESRQPAALAGFRTVFTEPLLQSSLTCP